MNWTIHTASYLRRFSFFCLSLSFLKSCHKIEKWHQIISPKHKDVNISLKLKSQQHSLKHKIEAELNKNIEMQTLAAIFLFTGAMLSPETHSLVLVSFRNPPNFSSSTTWIRKKNECFLKDLNTFLDYDQNRDIHTVVLFFISFNVNGFRSFKFQHLLPPQHVWNFWYKIPIQLSLLCKHSHHILSKNLTFYKQKSSP